MARTTKPFCMLSMIALIAMLGCASTPRGENVELADFVATKSRATMDAPSNQSVPSSVRPVSYEAAGTDLEPFSLRRPVETGPQPWELSLDEVVRIALANSTVLRTLGARIIQTPGVTPTIYEPAIQVTDPSTGIEAALSAFDAQLQGDLLVEDNDRVLNNEFAGQGTNFFRQYLTKLESSVSKQTVSGTIFTLRHNFDADLNNSDRNIIEGRAWAWNLEGEVRHPLLQGRGVSFNRVAGPNAVPGVYNGVVIARLNADITIAQLEIALRDFLSDVENAYWDLYFAYQDLNVKRDARDRTLHTYQLLQARQGLAGAEEDKVAQAREQYFRFEQEVQNALAGRLVIGTRSFNGSGGGTFQGGGGVYTNERRLRLIMGLPINDGRLIRTTSQPADAPTTYDWNNLASNAVSRRTELRQQRLSVQRRRHELVASKNFLLPRVDAIGRYRYRGLGNSLFDRRIIESGSIVESDTHEFLMGMSVAYPVGMRQASAAVRNAQLRLAREQSLLEELQRQVLYGVSNAIGESDRAYSVLRSAVNRKNAAQDQYDILVSESQAPVRQFNYNALLDAEQRLGDASTAEIRARIQYGLAIKNLNFEVGALLEYYNIHLADTELAMPQRPSHRHLTGKIADGLNQLKSTLATRRVKRGKQASKPLIANPTTDGESQPLLAGEPKLPPDQEKQTEDDATPSERRALEEVVLEEASQAVDAALEAAVASPSDRKL
ncbi:MAG: TolC family protein [Planctomycetota bacterium]